MADFKYIDEEYAQNKVPEPNGEAQIGDLHDAILDATDEIDAFLRENGVKVSLPLADKYRTDFFKIAVAHWVACILYRTHSQGATDQKKSMCDDARSMMLTYIKSTNFDDDPISEDLSKPVIYPYSNKGELKQTDLSDPLDLNNTYDI